MSEIRVTVSSYGAGRNLVLRYTDPITGKRVARSAGTSDPTEAAKEAGKWEDELRSGRYQAPSKLTWAEFRERVEAEKLAAMPKGSQEQYCGALSSFERLVGPDRMTKVTPRLMSRYQAEARQEGIKETTLHKHLRHLKACFRWAERQGLIAKAPHIEMPKLGGGYLGKHRAISGEEFDRLLLALPKVRKHDAPQWERLLRGLWLSGLRLGEALLLTWDDGPFVLDTDGKHPAFRIQGIGQKSRKSELCPCTPDFAAWILGATPEADRQGKVFPIVGPNRNIPARGEVGRVIGAVGRKAGIIVGETEKVTKDKQGRLVRTPTKLFCTAHDLRRSFCTRWAKKVMPPVLQRLARHSSVTTTLTFYACMSADDVAADLWANHPATEDGRLASGNTVGNTRPEEAENEASQN
ncbi:MAG TPA: hypothetical protein DD670_10690 [Planctomycetaceae bacterium]|nr:hypothetical protein [Planctomycetaceae bacterium]